MRRLLNICIQIEETVGKIYRKMVESPQLSSAVRQTLNELANDEDEHAAQLRFALRFPEDSVVSCQPEMLNKNAQLLKRAEDILTKISAHQVDDRQAISVGVELEKSFCQAHIGSSFKFRDESLKAMFAAMARADEEHCKRLLDLQKNLL